MSKDFDSKCKLLQSKDNKSSSAKEHTPALKLVVSNPAPSQGTIITSQPTPPNTVFSAQVRKKGSDLYEMIIQDSFHDLECGLILDIERKDSETTVVCHFSALLSESHKFLEEDETLYGITVVQFQMKILEQLFLFCIEHDASQLMIYMDDEQAEGFGIYQDYLIHCYETLTENGEKTEMLFSTNREDFDVWLDFMKKMNVLFEQDLWREQRSNPSIRRYLKSRP